MGAAKLSELGQLNKECLEIITKLTGQVPEIIYTALESAALEATKDVEPKLKKAAKLGKIEAAATDNVIASESVIATLRAYASQAIEKTNLVNTTMLESSLALYRQVVVNTANIENQMAAIQQALNEGTARVAVGVESRRTALKTTLEQIHKNGITGFFDKAGRKWSPEAYVNMDIRTTVHNTAIETVKLRQRDYGVEILEYLGIVAHVPCAIHTKDAIFLGITQVGRLLMGKVNNIGTILYHQPATESLRDFLALTADITR